MKRKAQYQNTRTREIREFEAEVDNSNHLPMYTYEGGDEWKAVSKWTLNVVNSSEFFRSAHENTIKFTKPPLEGNAMPYGVT